MSSPNDDPSRPPPEEGEQQRHLSRPVPKDRTEETETVHYDAKQVPPDDDLIVENTKTVISRRPQNVQPPLSGANHLVGETLVGTHLEHFMLEEFVGKGGMGAVFRASDNKLGRTVAVKVLSQNRTDSDSLRRFTNEAQSAARLDHPNIARVYYVGEDRGWHFIVFEYINGVNIRDLVEHKGPLPLDEAWSYVLQISDALVHASERDVVHRDIKPSNILVTSQGTAKLVDMGLARLHQVENTDSDVTASGVTLGTFDYISPEQARDPRTTDVRSDIYSLGCTLYYMLTGLAPYPTGTVLQKLLSHSSDPPPNPQIYRNDLDDGTVRILHKMLAKRPGDRYQQPRDMIVDVLSLVEQLGLKIKQDGRNWESPPARSPFNWLNQLSLVIPVACLLGLVFTLNLFNSSDSEVVMALPTFSTAPYEFPMIEPGFEDEGVESYSAPPPDETTASSEIQAENTTDVIRPEFQTVIVGRPEATLPDGFSAVDSLSRALALLPQDSDIAVIEVWDDSSITLDNLVLDLNSWLQRPLIIRGVEGQRPVITIDLSEVALETIEPVFIQIAGGFLHFDMLDIRFILPGEVRQGWSLFELQGGTGFRLSNTRLTVLSATAEFSNPIGPVSIFRVIENPGNIDSLIVPAETGSQLATLQIDNSIVRGSATLISNSGKLSLKSRIENSLIVCSERLLDLVIPTAPSFLTQVQLSNVTAYAGSGAVRVHDENEAGLVPLDLSMKNSAVVTDLGKPFILLEQPELDAAIPFVVKLENSAIDNTSVMLERRDQYDLELSKQMTFTTLLQAVQSGSSPGWWSMTNSVNGVVWSNPQVPSPDLLLHQQGISEFTTANFVDDKRGIDPLMFEKSEVTE